MNVSKFSGVFLPCLALIGATFPISAMSAPALNQISGEVSPGLEVVVQGSGFGTKPQAAPIFFDAVDKVWINGVESQPYAGLNDGDAIPTGDGWPWVRGKTGPVALSRTGDDGARYRTVISPDEPRDAWLENPAGFPDPASQEVQELYVRWWFKSSFDPNQQAGSHKFIRVWDTDSGADYGIRISWTQMHLTGPGKTCRADGTVGDKPSWANWGGDAGQWTLMELHVDIPDGRVRAWTNGNLIHDVSGYNPSASYTCVNGEVVGDGKHNGIRPRLWGLDGSGDASWVGETVEVMDYYADSTIARIEIGDASSWDQVRIREPQVPISWSDTSIRFKVNQGRLGSLSGKYLYVIDGNGVVNESGLPLEAVSPPKSPVLDVE